VADANVSELALNVLKMRVDEGYIVTSTVSGERDNGRLAFLLTLKKRGIGDHAVLRAMDEVPRENFVAPEFFERAFADQALPIACGQTISQPFVVAYMTEQLALRPHHRVLEIGAGSGYQAAVLSRLAREVVTIERYRTLSDAARERLRVLGYDNVEVIAGDGLAGCADKAPFDRVVVTAAAEEVPQVLVDQLADDGIMLLPLGPHGGPQQIVKLTKSQTSGAATITRETLIAVRFVPLLPGQAREL
jgi:protein-L-isoaspartate(D-aspartate) O-methyltransferase